MWLSAGPVRGLLLYSALETEQCYVNNITRDYFRPISLARVKEPGTVTLFSMDENVVWSGADSTWSICSEDPPQTL